MDRNKLLHRLYIKFCALDAGIPEEWDLFDGPEIVKAKKIHSLMVRLKNQGAFCNCHHCNTDKYNDCLDMATAIEQGYTPPNPSPCPPATPIKEGM